MSKRRLLVVEDEEHTRSTLTLLLEHAGYSVLETESGTEALYLILAHRRNNQPIELMVLDIEVYGLSGLKLLDILEQQQAAVPTILITGLTRTPRDRLNLRLGSLDYLPKPFTPDTLISRVSAMLPSHTPDTHSSL